MGKLCAAMGLALVSGCTGGIPYTPPSTRITVHLENTGTGSADGEVKEWNGSPRSPSPWRPETAGRFRSTSSVA